MSSPAPWLTQAIKLDHRQVSIRLGLRAAAATFVPLVVGATLGHPAAHWAGIAGFTATTADKGGAYAVRARTFLSLGLAGAVTVALGGLVHGSLWLSVAVAFLVVTAGAAARVLGNEAIGVGTVSSVLFLVSQSQPTDWSIALQRSAFVFAGVAWAALLALVLWPVQQFAPARRAVAACFERLAERAKHLTELAEAHRVHAWHQAHRADIPAVRASLEAARAQLSAIRGNTRGLTGKAAWLLGLIQTADQTHARLLALADLVDAEALAAATPEVRSALLLQLEAVAEACRAMARFALEENEATPPPRANVEVGPMLAAVHDSTLPELARAQVAHAAELLRSIDTLLESVTPVTTPLPEAASPVLAALKSLWSFDSVETRHALRVGVLVAGSVGVVEALHIDHGYWGTITMLVVLQPHAPDTFMRSLQRVVGAVAGSLLAAGLTAVISSPTALLPVCAVMAAVSVSVISVNYALYSTLLTPTFLLLAQLDGHDPRLATLRAGTNVAAGAVALLASRLLWPMSERQRIHEAFAAAMRSIRRLFALAAERPASVSALDAARRDVGVAMANAEVSLQRVVAEQRAETELEPLITVLLYARRFSWTAIGLASAPAGAALPPELRQAFDEALHELEEALAQRRTPKAWSSMGLSTAPVDPVVQAQLERLVQHLTVLHDAATRIVWAHSQHRFQFDRPRLSK